MYFSLCLQGFYSLLKWCQRRDLNPRPKAYESSALPLSYSGNPHSLPDLFRPVNSIIPFVYRALLLFCHPKCRPGFQCIAVRTQALSC